MHLHIHAPVYKEEALGASGGIHPCILRSNFSFVVAKDGEKKDILVAFCSLLFICPISGSDENTKAMRCYTSKTQQ